MQSVILSIYKLYTNTYNKAITILDENITESTVASEKSLKVSFPGAVWKPTDIDPCPYHTVKKQLNHIRLTTKANPFFIATSLILPYFRKNFSRSRSLTRYVNPPTNTRVLILKGKYKNTLHNRLPGEPAV